ncbi:MAG: arginase family protein [Myxococcota bacterium]|jgi:agmatinase|nr:arginase family protein [Myxococcota bacterium]
MRRPSHLAVLALPFEVTTSFQKGTAYGPSAILQEIEVMDVFDLTLGRSPFDGVPVTMIRPHGPELTDQRLQQAITSRIITEILSSGGFPISLGGEHTVCLGPISAASALGPLGVVHLDARADLRVDDKGERFSHTAVMHRVLDIGCPVLGVGIRSMGAQEAEVLATHELSQVSGRQFRDSTDWYGLIDALPERVYLTIDMNVFDPADVPAVSAPVPGGPGWDQVCDFLFHLFERKDVVAADVVELSPGPGEMSSVRLAARLVGMMTGLRFS